MKKLLIIATALIIGIINAPVTHAASVYDDVVVLAHSLYVGTDINVTNDYMSYVTGTAAAYNQCDSTCKSYINDVIASGSGWYITQVYSTSPSLATAAVCMRFTNDTSARLSFQANSSYRRLYWDPSHSPATSYSVCLYPDGSGGVNTIYDGSDVARINISTSVNDVRPLLSTVPIDYPSGYAGTTVPDTFTPPNGPQFVWGVDDNGVVTSTYTQNLTGAADDVIQHCGLKWTLYNSDSSWNTGTVVDTQTHPPTMTYRYDHITAGFYQLKSEANWCIPYIDDGSITPITVNIPYNGSFVGGTSGSGGGNTGGPFADQSTYLNQFGFTQAVQAPLNMISDLTDTSCSPVVLPSFGGGDITIPCLSGFYANISVAYNLWQITIAGITGYWFSIKAFHHIRGLLNPNNDAIATVDL